MDALPKTPLPPGLTDADLRRMSPRYREDAIQEAWVAHLEGRDPAKAAAAYRQREMWYENRHVPVSQLSDREDNDAAL